MKPVTAFRRVCGSSYGVGRGAILQRELRVLADHLRLSVAETIERYCREVSAGRFSLKEGRNSRGEHDCIFLREDPAERAGNGGEKVVHGRRSCTIYAVRPLQCRTWPFWESNLSSREIWESSAKRCHGMNKGRRFSREEMEGLRDAEDWPERPPTSG